MIVIAENKQALSPSQALARDLATELGKGWRFTQPKEPYPYATIDGPDGYALSVSIQAYGAKKGLSATIAGIFPNRDARGNFFSGPGGHEIGVTATRGAKVIAREIERRLMPDYKKTFAEHTARLADTNAYLASTATTAQLIADAVPSIVGRKNFEKGEISIHVDLGTDSDVWGSLKTSDERVSIDLSNIPRDLAIAMLRVLAEHTK